ncbi:hypothetical protein NFX52_10570, partial [Acidovorax facilis]
MPVIPIIQMAQKHLFVRLFFLIGVVSLSACDFKNSEFPDKWKIDYSGKRIYELKLLFGKPDEDVSEKQFLNWIDRDEEGMKILKVVCADRCSDDEYPTRILFYRYF